ncbi:PREDICTED: putative HERV-K_Xq28 provirus ancestral Pol protein [Tinamus guttatus]|uniref:putative HERV-K_Xq28 provirus ancestral Pol protein n=1 Tax=Tinamus guttatus TaxID=94827 RepID=UPI00052F0285|nr:PREDICTED: putative HERV-K_Xq28 provirus ancestral Pol protein [Tinamus guttatus]
MIPADRRIEIIDLQDCSYTIPLNPKDSDKFAFSIPSVNAAKSPQQCQWPVLLQGMKKSPTLCQWFVAKTLSPVQIQHKVAIIYHYMDDILIACSTATELETVMKTLIKEVTRAGLVIAPEQVRVAAPWQYLGWTITSQAV